MHASRYSESHTERTTTTERKERAMTGRDTAHHLHQQAATWLDRHNHHDAADRLCTLAGLREPVDTSLADLVRQAEQEA